MMKDTHVLGGLIFGTAAVGIGLDTFNNIPLIQVDDVGVVLSSVLLISSSTLGSLYPDVDHRGSYMGRRLLISSGLIALLRWFAQKIRNKKMKKWFAHRGFMHSAVVWIIHFFLFNIVFTKLQQIYPNYYEFINILKIIFIGISIGALSHITLDAFNPGGVPLFLPFSYKKYRFPINFKTGLIENKKTGQKRINNKEKIFKGFLIIILILMIYILFLTNI